VVDKARTVLQSVVSKTRSLPRDRQEAPVQASLFEEKDTGIIDEILKADPNRMTPLEALNFLQKLRDRLDPGDGH